MKNMLKKLFFILASFSVNSLSGAAVNINTASETELETLNSIGPGRAKAIINYRNQHGAFPSVESIKNVPGVTAMAYEKIKDDIVLVGPTIPITTKK